MSIIEKYEIWLQNKGYSRVTSSGRPSTTYDYAKRVKQVASEEGMEIHELAECR